MAPTGDNWDQAVAWWSSLPSDPGASYDKEVTLKAEDIVPTVTWGTSPEDALPITSAVPIPNKEQDIAIRDKLERAINYMGLTAGQISKLTQSSLGHAQIAVLKIYAQQRLWLMVVRFKSLSGHLLCQVQVW